ncbi:hypothetical protein SynWH8101_1427 [Synechococcus sp. WH 8101]|uniref:hypothetical protein n=1 Tax=Synechococcus sp. WH 8101 TaxID=59932 RepID=UPI0010239E3C|nr:hypothetical protein [Synechococcus sp. WH 8101]QBE69011.1 hypothetical protein SynWH8101_1427 [Synechococcus sp. WH 8101]QNI45242.1 hypothetical protein SynRCC2555_01459 [Synechococcus sp. WH 8101]
MSELLSALKTALSEDLAANISLSKESVDQFLIDQGYDPDRINDEFIGLLDDQKVEHAQLLELNDYSTLFSSREAALGFIDKYSINRDDDSIQYTGAGFGHVTPGHSLSNIRNKLQSHRSELQQREASLLQERGNNDLTQLKEQDIGAIEHRLSNFKEVSSVLENKQEHRSTGSHREIHHDRETLENHSRAFSVYKKAYIDSRVHIEDISVKNLELDLAHRIVAYQVKKFYSGYVSASQGKQNGHDWSSSFKNTNWYDGVDYNETNYSYSDNNVQKTLSVGFIQGGLAESKQTGAPPVTIGYYFDPNNKDDTQINASVALDPKTATASWTYTKSTKKGCTPKSGTISFGSLKMYQRDQEVLKKYRDGTLIPHDLKLKFGRVLALSAIAYNLKRDITIEKRFWPDQFSNIVERTRTHSWGKAYSHLNHQRSAELATLKSNSHNQKRDARGLRMLYGAELAANKTEEYAIKNSENVYKRAFSDGLSKSTAFKLADLCYVSDLVLFDSFLASKALPRLANGELSTLTGDKALEEMTYRSMPFVIRRQIHESHHILNLEVIDQRDPKTAEFLYTYDKFKNNCLTELLKYSDTYYSNYLGFHPVHRVFRFSKDKILGVTNVFEHYVFDPILHAISWTRIPKLINNSTLLRFLPSFTLSGLFNGAIGFTEGLVFAMAHGIKTFPKHLYKDTRNLSRQLGKIFKGEATWKGSFNAYRRDTSMPRKLFMKGYKYSELNYFVHKIRGKQDPVFKNISDTANMARVGISGMRHKAKIKKDLVEGKVEIRLHKQLHEFAPNLIKSPYELLEMQSPKVKVAQHKLVDQLKTLAKADITQMADITQIEDQISSHKHADMLRLFRGKYNKSLKASAQAFNEQIQGYLANWNAKAKLQSYIKNNTVEERKYFKAVHARQAQRLKDQVTALEFAHEHRRLINNDLPYAIKLQKSIKHTKRLFETMYSSEIKSDWKSGGKKLFKNLFVYPIGNTIPLPKNQKRDVRREISKFFSYNIGEKVFGAILLEDYASRVLNNTSVIRVDKRISAALRSTSVGTAVADLVRWDNRKLRSDLGRLNRIASLDINKSTVVRTGSYARRALRQFASKFKIRHPKWAKADMTWYKNESSNGRFLKTWRPRISKDASKGKGVAIAWQQDVNAIKSGQTLTVGEVINSLKPSQDQWGLHLEKPSDITQPVTPAHNGGNSSNPDNVINNKDSQSSTSNDTSSDKIKVNIFGYAMKIKMSSHLIKKIWNKATKKEDKKDSGDKSDDNIRENAESDVKRDISSEENILKSDLEADLANEESAIVDTVVDESEAVIVGEGEAVEAGEEMAIDTLIEL